MRNNARKILSFVLSFIMVFGSVATLLPTTVMAASETQMSTITLVDQNGEVLASDEFQIGETIDLHVLSKLTYKNSTAEFLVWVDQDTDKVYGSSFVVPDRSMVLQADYKPITFLYTADQIIAKLTSFELHTDEDGTTYARVSVASKRAANYSWKSIMELPLDDVGVFVINYRTDVNQNTNTEQGLQFYYTASSYNTSKTDCNLPDEPAEDGFYYSNAKYTLDLLKSDQPAAEKIYGVRFIPWGNATVTAICDIRYFAVFDNADLADAFDYDKYCSCDVTFTDENDKIITSISAKSGSTIDAILEANPAAKALIDKATAQTATRVLAGWELEDGTAVDANTTISANTTLKPSFSKYKLYTPADLMAEYESGRIDTSHFNLSTTSYESRNFLHLQSKVSGSHKFEWTFEPAMTGYTTIVMPHITNTTWGVLSQSSFVQVLPSADQTNWDGITNHYHAKTSTNIVESADGTSVSGTDDILAIYDISDEESAGRFKFAPWRGRNIYSDTSTSICIGPAKLSKTDSDAYVDIEYIAFFEKADAAEYFNYGKYLAQKDTAYFKNAEGAIVDELTQSATDGIITLPDYDDDDFLGWQIEGASDNTLYAADDEIAISRPTVFVPFMSVPVELTVTDKEGTKTIETSVGLNMPLDELVLQYIDAEGELMVISGFSVGETEYPIDDGYIVNETETSIDVFYAPAYILSAADGTLETGTSRNAATVNAPVDVEEDGVYFKHITGVKDATTVATSQARFDLTEEGDDINKNASKITYGETPYVSYLYRTNIDLAVSGQTLMAAYTVNKFAKNGDYTGTAKFSQVIENVESHNDWQILVHKAESFGKMTADAEFPGYLDGIYISPWANVENIELTGEEYADIQYIGFFPNETSAKMFDHDSYLDTFKVDVTVEIDGVVNEALGGRFTSGTVIKLPDVPGVAGYLYDGMLVNSVKVPEDEDGDGEITISVTSRKVVNLDEYIKSRGNLDNLKKAGEDGSITVVYIGGSATSGSGASNKAFCWASLTTDYLKTKYANVEAYNEGLGGHGSRSAAFRLQKDVIGHKPDIVFIETSMNDHYDGDAPGGNYDGKYYEYVIRTIREALPNTEIVTVYTINNGLVKGSDNKLREGKHPAAAGQDAIAEYYGVPSIDIGKYAFEAIFGENGTYSTETWKKYYKDSVHPLDSGYAIYARAIREYLEAALEGECPETVDEETCPDTVLNDGVLTFNPSVIELYDDAVSVSDSLDVIEQLRSTTFTHYIKTKDNPGSGTIKFSFVGTEFGIYMSMPGDNFDAETDGELSENAQGTVTVKIDGIEYTTAPAKKSPWMYGENLENTRHDVTITLTNVDNTECRIYGLLVSGELTQYTVELTAAPGGQVSYNGGEPGESFKIYAMNGDEIILKAHADEGNHLRAWHDLTNGQITPVTDPDGNPYPADNIPTTITYKVTGDALINANFVPDEIAAPARLVAFIDRGNRGTIMHNGSNITYVDDYVSASVPTTLTAKANDGYVAAYWKRLTQDSDVEVFVSAGADAGVYALGGYVFYQPVFLVAGETVDLYISGTTNEILSIDEAPEGYTYGEKDACSNDVVSVYVCTKNASVNDGNLFTAYDMNKEQIESSQTPAFGENIIVKKTKSNTNPLWTVVVGDREYVASYKDNFSFNYMFAAGTAVEVYEKSLEGEAVPTVSTVASWTEGTQAKFAGLFALPAGYELVNHGIMMSQSEDDLMALDGNSTGEISVYDGTVIGRVRDNTENATPLFTVTKTLASESDKWYGRAFLVYKDAEGNTHLIYASTASASLAEGDNDGDQVFYAPDQIGE